MLADDPGDAHQVDQSAGAGVPDRKAPLEQAHRATLGFEHDLHRTVEERVFLRRFERGAGVVLAHLEALLVRVARAKLHELTLVRRARDLAHELDDVADLGVLDERALRPVQLVVAG